mgnify:CR=1 FL=1
MHENGIVHRDIKPANILITHVRIVLCRITAIKLVTSEPRFGNTQLNR